MLKRYFIAVALLAVGWLTWGCTPPVPSYDVPPDDPANSPLPGPERDPNSNNAPLPPGGQREPAPGDVATISATSAFVATGVADESNKNQVTMTLGTQASLTVEKVTWRISEVRDKRGHLLWDISGPTSSLKAFGGLVTATDKRTATFTPADLVTEPLDVIITITAPLAGGTTARLTGDNEFLLASFTLEVRPPSGALSVAAAVFPGAITINGSVPANRTATLRAVIVGGSPLLAADRPDFPAVGQPIYDIQWFSDTIALPKDNQAFRLDDNDGDGVADTIISERTVAAEAPAGPRLYKVSVRDARGNEATGVAVLTVNEELKVRAVLAPAVFVGNETGLRPQLTATASGGTGKYTYTWTTEPVIDGLFDAPQGTGQTITFQASKLGGQQVTFVVTAEDDAGNVAIARVRRGESSSDIPQPPPPPPPIPDPLAVSIRNTPDCVLAGQSIILDATVTGGVQPVTWQWTQTCSGLFSDDKVVAPYWTAPISPAQCVLTLTATDNVGTIVSSPVGIEVKIPTVSFVAGTSAPGESVGIHTIAVVLSVPNTCSPAVTAGAITVQVTDAGGGTAGPGDFLPIGVTTLTFPAGSTDGAGPTIPLRVTIINDPIDEPVETINLKLGTITGIAQLGSQVTHTVQIQDDDLAGITIAQTGGTTEVDENGPTSDTYTITLDTQPTANVIITVKPNAQIDIGAGPANAITLTFTPANWNIPQTVTATAVDDMVDETSPHMGLITHTVSSLDPIYNGASVANVTPSITDNDTQGFVLSALNVLVTEGGTATFTVALATEPTSDVFVDVARISGDSDINVQSGASLTFSPANYSVPRTVTLAAELDADTQNGSAIIRIRSLGIPDATVTATEVDVNTQNLIVTGSPVTVPEGGTAQIFVRLLYNPLGPVTVNVARLSGDTDITVASGATLLFTAFDYFLPQAVTLAAAEDADVLNGTAVIRVSSAGIPDVDVTAIENDNDTQSFIITGAPVTVPEGGTATIQVRLAANPLGNVTVTVAHFSGDADISVVGGASLTFNGGNYSTNQTVTLAAAEDADTANGSAVIRISGGGISPVTVTATESDNDTPAVIVTESGGSTVITEGGATDTYSLVLGTQPASNVIITVQPNAQVDLGAGPGTAVTRTFTSGNWNTPQAITVTAVDDRLVESLAPATHAGLITHSAGGDAAYAGIAIAGVTAQITDNDTATVAFSTASSSVGEANIVHTLLVKLTLSASGTGTVATAVPIVASVTDALTGTATSGVDYEAVGIVPITFVAGSGDNAQQTFALSIKHDTDVEGNETIDVDLAVGSGPASLGAQSTHQVTILDND